MQEETAPMLLATWFTHGVYSLPSTIVKLVVDHLISSVVKLVELFCIIFVIIFITFDIIVIDILKNSLMYYFIRTFNLLC